MRHVPYFTVKLTQIQSDGTTSQIFEKAPNTAGINKIIENFFFEYNNIQSFLQNRIYDRILVNGYSGYTVIMSFLNSKWQIRIEINLVS